MREPYKDLLEECEKERDELKEFFMDSMGQGCGTWNREKDSMEYDHMCMSTWEHMTDYALTKGWIKKEQLLR